MAMFLGGPVDNHPKRRVTTKVERMGDEFRVTVYVGKDVRDVRVFDTKDEVNDFLANLNLESGLRGLGCACGM